MKIILISLLAAFFMTSCAHHHKDVAHHHHNCDKNCKKHHEKDMFDKHCAQSVSEGDFHAMGKDDYKLEHGGQTYYFSSKEKLGKFKKDIEANAKAARTRWQSRMR
tara:strand:+ start:172387 stop:172704 length:318 start_codon:yes stop_codon:yes gene_type:complete